MTAGIPTFQNDQWSEKLIPGIESGATIFSTGNRWLSSNEEDVGDVHQLEKKARTPWASLSESGLYMKSRVSRFRHPSRRILSFGKNALLGFLEKGNDLFFRNGWISVEKILDRLTWFQIINQGSHRHSRSLKYRRSTHNFCIDWNCFWFHDSNISQRKCRYKVSVYKCLEMTFSHKNRPNRVREFVLYCPPVFLSNQFYRPTNQQT